CPAGNWEGVASACGKAIQANPRFSLPLVLQAAALSFLGRRDEAAAAARRVPELEPGFTVSGFVRAHTGRAEIWQPIGDALRQAGLPEWARKLAAAAPAPDIVPSGGRRRTGSSPTRSGPEGSSRNEFRPGSFVRCPTYPAPRPSGHTMTDSATSYRVLARKYRPQTFAEVIGQEAMVRPLSNAIETGRIAHAFILTGVRGVGKTTTARIIARALNCIGPD